MRRSRDPGISRLVNSSSAAIHGRATPQTKVNIGKDRIRQCTATLQDNKPPPPPCSSNSGTMACYRGSYTLTSPGEPHLSPWPLARHHASKNTGGSCRPQKTITVGSYNPNVGGQFPPTKERNHFVDKIRQTFDQSKISILENSVIQLPGQEVERCD